MSRDVNSFYESMARFKLAVEGGEYNDILSAGELCMLQYIFNNVMLQQDESGNLLYRPDGTQIRDVVCFFYIPAYDYCINTGVKYSAYVKAINGLVDKGIIYKTGKLKKYGRGYTHLYNWNGDLLGLMDRFSDWGRYGKLESTVSPAEFIQFYLQSGPKTIQQMCDESGITRQRISYALTKMEQDGVIVIKKDGKFRSIELAGVKND